MIFKDGDDSAGFATTLTTNNYRTGSAGTTLYEMQEQPTRKCRNDPPGNAFTN
jgi:hypothetical protein